MQRTSNLLLTLGGLAVAQPLWAAGTITLGWEQEGPPPATYTLTISGERTQTQQKISGTHAACGTKNSSITDKTLCAAVACPEVGVVNFILQAGDGEAVRIPSNVLSGHLDAHCRWTPLDTYKPPVTVGDAGPPPSDLPSQEAEPTEPSLQRPDPPTVPVPVPQPMLPRPEPAWTLPEHEPPAEVVLIQPVPPKEEEQKGKDTPTETEILRAEVAALREQLTRIHEQQQRWLARLFRYARREQRAKALDAHLYVMERLEAFARTRSQGRPSYGTKGDAS